MPKAQSIADQKSNETLLLELEHQEREDSAPENCSFVLNSDPVVSPPASRILLVYDDDSQLLLLDVRR